MFQFQCYGVVGATNVVLCVVGSDPQILSPTTTSIYQPLPARPINPYQSINSQSDQSKNHRPDTSTYLDHTLGPQTT